MIFVTVGTHEQPFNRLLKEVDNLVKEGFITDKVIMQTGYSTYTPKYCEFQKMMSYEEMQSNFKSADMVITHGGPSSFIEALQYKKVPLVVPREEKYGEHVNNHQVEFVKLISERMNNIIPVYDISNLKNIILNYTTLVKNKNTDESNNNEQFNKKIETIIGGLLQK